MRRTDAPCTVRLVPVDVTAPAAVDELVTFVNAHYKSELPLHAEGLTSGHYRFFWAMIDGSDDDANEVSRRVGCSAYVTKTPYLAESVKTVVDPAHRRGGLGAAISLAIEEQVRADGFKKIMSTILINNIPMIVIKLRQGYIVEGIHMDHEKPGLHEYSLGKVFR